MTAHRISHALLTQSTRAAALQASHWHLTSRTRRLARVAPSSTLPFCIDGSDTDCDASDDCNADGTSDYN